MRASRGHGHRRRRHGPALLGAVAVATAAVAGAPSPARAAEPTVTVSQDVRGDSCFVDGSYQLFLSRRATPSESTLWVQRLATGTSRSALVSSLSSNREWLALLVDALYRRALDRGSDPVGAAYWVERLRTGTSVGAMAAAVYGSEEFYRRAGSTPETFVAGLYERILDRPPDRSGTAYWIGELAVSGRSQVASRLHASAESRRDRTTVVYGSVLGRLPDAAGLAYWAERLRTVDDVRMTVHLASAAEFYRRAGRTCATDRVSAGGTGSWGSTISGSGRHVVFGSASDLLPGDGDGDSDVFVRDLVTGATTRAPHGAGGAYSPTVSDDGRFVSYRTRTWTGPPTSAWVDAVWLWDRAVGTVTLVTDRASEDRPTVSGDGTHVVFTSADRSLVPGGTGAGRQVFVWERTTGALTRITDAQDDVEEPAISDDGSVVAFRSWNGVIAGDTDPVPGVYVWREGAGTIVRISDDAGGLVRRPDVSGDGRYVTYPYASLALSPDGVSVRYEVYVWDAVTGGTVRVTAGDGDSMDPVVTDDGRHVAFSSEASDLVPGDTNGHDDVFVWDAASGAVRRITEGDSMSAWPAISDDGRLVTFLSYASNLVPGDRDDGIDLFVWDRLR